MPHLTIHIHYRDVTNINDAMRWVADNDIPFVEMRHLRYMGRKELRAEAITMLGETIYEMNDDLQNYPDDEGYFDYLIREHDFVLLQIAFTPRLRFSIL